MSRPKVEEKQETQSIIAYESILYNAFLRAVTMRAEDPYRAYPLAVESLSLAVPKYNNIERDIEEFKKNEWENIKREIGKRSDIDERRKKTLIFDALFTFVKHKLEDSNLLLKFRKVPIGGGFDSW